MAKSILVPYGKGLDPAATGNGGLWNGSSVTLGTRAQIAKY